MFLVPRLWLDKNWAGRRALSRVSSVRSHYVPYTPPPDNADKQRGRRRRASLHL